MQLLRSLAPGLTVLVLACSEPTSAGIASSVTGSWETRFAAPGSGFWMTLANDGSSLSGSGIVLVEAGDGGYSTIEGGVDRTVVTLDFTPLKENPDGAATVGGHFTGRLEWGELRGTMQFNGPSSTDTVPIVFVRKTLTPI